MRAVGMCQSDAPRDAVRGCDLYLQQPTVIGRDEMRRRNNEMQAVF